ncbi:phage tail assembly protein [Comamonas sediminis]|uniref:Phage tail assembly protein n=1 Tax=Comamonas sediminis TaxID=1783360 RepID=A0ABV4B4M1_9BURK
MSDKAETENTNTNTAAAQAGQATADNQAMDETINGRPYQLVPLETPIKRAGGDITEIKVMKPLGGDLRGLSIKSLADMDALSVQVLLPRITQPSIIQAEANALDLVDLANCAGVVWDFLQPSSVRKAIRQ